MSDTLLFPNPPLTIEPAADRQEPALWVRRLVVVPSLASDAVPIREVTLRPGLNIIHIAARPPGETRVMGHSVGKTLFTRLIRYCLGESHFAVETVRKRIRALLPDAHVVTEIRLTNQTWIVSRPLYEAPVGASWAVSGEDWRAALAKPIDSIPFPEFVRHVELMVLGVIPDIALPGVGRPIRWLDLLGWLARDHECRYRIYNEWREPDSESGTGKLSRDDAAFLMRLVMGLFDAKERPLIEAHRTLLAELETTKSQYTKLSRFIENTFPFLRTRLGLSEEECGQDQQLVGGLFATRAHEAVTLKEQKLRRLSADLRAGSRVEELYQASILAAQQLAVLETELKRSEGLKQQAEVELKQCEQANSSEFYKTFSLAVNCRAEHCPQRPPANSSSFQDPNRQSRIAELRVVLQQHVSDIEVHRQQVAQAQRTSDEARTTYKDEQQRLNRNTRGISRDIGRWNLLVEQANDYETSLKSLVEADTRLTRLNAEYTESLAQLETARKALASERAKLSDHFDWTLKQLLGDEATGSIGIDARGLHPKPGDSVASNGAAISTLATVIALDLACVTASIAGIGSHPRFVIHDSPREAEMESVLFQRIFQLAATVEDSFDSTRSPSFQYIITTSSSVPSKFAEEPFTRVVLDARQDATHFLGIRFY